MWGSTGEFPDGTAAFHNTLLTSLPAEAQSPVTSATDCFFFFCKLAACRSFLVYAKGNTLDIRGGFTNVFPHSTNIESLL